MGRHIRILVTLLIGVHLSHDRLAPITASGLTFQNPVSDFRPAFERAQGQPISIHPFAKSSLELTSPRLHLNLLERGVTDFESTVRHIIQGMIGSPLLRIQSQLSNKGSLTRGSESRNFKFYVGQTEICDYGVRAHLRSSQHTPLILGDVPEVSPLAYQTSLQDWPLKQEALQRSLEALDDFSISTLDYKLLSAKSCYLVSEGQLIPVWKLSLAADALAFNVTASAHEIFDLTPAYISLTGTADVYASNPEDGSTVRVTITDLDNSNKLSSSKMLTTTNFSLSGVNEAEKSDRQFIYEPIEYNPAEGMTVRNNFDEVSVFFHAQKTSQWYENYGFSEYTGKRLLLSIHAKPSNQTNNAMYFPAVGSTPQPRIELGDGDGEVLINLPKDRDVIAHEFGHHVIFETLTKTDGESLVLHEGLADFLTFANHGDPCLGESICPVNSPMGCEVNAQCLRTGDNSYTLQSAPAGAHFRSQFISGWLWKLRDQNQIPANQLTPLVLGAIGKLTANSGYRNFILAMLHADEELYNSQYSEIIYTSAQDAGLSEYMTDFSHNGSSFPAIVDPLLPTQVTTTRSKNSSSNFWGCGVAQGHTGLAGVWLWILLPLVSALRDSSKNEE